MAKIVFDMETEREKRVIMQTLKDLSGTTSIGGLRQLVHLYRTGRISEKNQLKKLKCKIEQLILEK